MRRVIILFLFVAVAFCGAPPATSAGDMIGGSPQDVKVLDNTVKKYTDVARSWEPRIKYYAERLFWILVTISMVYTFCYMIVSGKSSLGDFFVEFVQFVITVGFFYWLLLNGNRFAASFINSMARMGREVSSSYLLELTPSNIVTFGFSLIMDSLESIPKIGLTMGLIIFVLSVAIAIIFAQIAFQMVMLLVSAWVLVYAGVFFLGFGGGKWTRDIAINYFKTIAGLAMQLFTFCLLVGIGQNEITNLYTAARKMKTVEVNKTLSFITGPSTVETSTITVMDAVVLFLFAFILMQLVRTLPGLIAGVVSGGIGGGGASTGGLGGGIASAIGGVAAAGAAMTTAGVMMGAQVGGVLQTLAAAYKQSASNAEAGEGMFKDKGDMGGLGKAMTYAKDMAANVAIGAARMAGDAISEKTVGGNLASAIKERIAEQMSEREQKAAEAEEAYRKADAHEASMAGEAKWADVSGGSSGEDGGSISAGGGSEGGSSDGGNWEPWSSDDMNQWNDAGAGFGDSGGSGDGYFQDDGYSGDPSDQFL